MTTHYVEIKPQARETISPQAIVSNVMQMLHDYLSTNRNDKIGVSFPEFSDNDIGKLIRLHSSEKHLSLLKSSDWLGKESKRVTVSAIRTAPIGAEKVVFKRFNFNQNNARANRHFKRYAKQHGHMPSIDYQIEYRSNIAVKMIDVARVTLDSNTNGNRYPLFIKKVNEQSDKDSSFNHFGLSDSKRQGQVPIF